MFIYTHVGIVIVKNYVLWHVNELINKGEIKSRRNIICNIQIGDAQQWPADDHQTWIMFNLIAILDPYLTTY